MFSRWLLVVILCLNVMVDAAPFAGKRSPATTFPAQKQEDQKQEQEEQKQEDLDCKFGQSEDEYGKKQCMKGPGEFCGGVNNIYGVCAPGMECSDCKRCRGCSLKTLKCFEDECLKILYRYYGKLG